MSKFSLAGGTGLALQLGHRISEDIDLFTLKSFNEEVIQVRYLDKKTLRFCSFYFDIPEENFRCFKSIQNF